MKIYIPLLLLIILTISFLSCSKITESTTSPSAEGLDLNEEQANRVQLVTAGLYGESKALRKLRDDVQDEILVQLKVTPQMRPNSSRCSVPAGSSLTNESP